jgi:hypothetical protein
MLLAIAALACSVTFQNPKPHVVTSAQDAIATAYADWHAAYPDPADSIRSWQKIYSAKFLSGTWVLTPAVPGGKPGLGTYIKIDARTGCIVSEVSFD